MGPEEKLVGGAAKSPNAGVKFLKSLALDASGLGYAVSCRLRPSNLLSVSASPSGGSHYAFMRAWSRQASATQSTNECLPKGEAGRAPLTKAAYFKKVSWLD